MQTVTNWPNRQ